MKENFPPSDKNETAKKDGKISRRAVILGGAAILTTGVAGYMIKKSNELIKHIMIAHLIKKVKDKMYFLAKIRGN